MREGPAVRPAGPPIRPSRAPFRQSAASAMRLRLSTAETWSSAMSTALRGLLRREDVAGAVHHAVVDGDAALGVQLLHQLPHRAFRHQLVIRAVQDQPVAGAGGEEAEIVVAGGRGDGHEAAHLRPAHQELHADIGAEGVARHPERVRVRVHRLEEVERGGRVADLADAAVVAALAPADTAEVEAQHGEAHRLEALVQGVDDAVVHGPAMQRVRVEQQGDWRVRLLGVVVAALKPTIRTGEHHLRHRAGAPVPR